MKNFIAITLISITSSSAIFGMQKPYDNCASIILPKAEILRKRLYENNLRHFVENTRIDKTLGGQEKDPFSVAISVEIALHDYNEFMQNPMLDKMMQAKKPCIIKSLLKEHPEAIECLKKDGVLK